MLEVAHVFRKAGPAYRERFAARMLPSHRKTMRDIEQCRTAALGGHLRQCDHCATAQYSYHSCRNRHCPKCHGDQSRLWLERQRSRLLPCSYFLLTFTLPEPLRELARAQQKIVYGSLLTAAAHSLLELIADPRWLGARPAVLAVLHTWTRDLRFHPHAHLLVSAGGLTADGRTWRWPAHRDFLVPCRALSVIFRAKVRDALQGIPLRDALPRNTWRRKWVVHAQYAGNGEQVLQYVARYVHRVAITNSRLESFDGQQVDFRYRDSRSGQLQRCNLTADQFIARFLQHVLPARFTKVRHYGLLGPRCRDHLERARSLLQPTAPSPDSAPAASANTDRASLPSARPDLDCPFCHNGVMRVIAQLEPRSASSPIPRAPPDLSS